MIVGTVIVRDQGREIEGVMMLWLSVALLVVGIGLEGFNIMVLRILSDGQVAKKPSPLVLLPLLFSITGAMTLPSSPMLARLLVSGVLLVAHVLLVFVLPGKYDSRKQG